ncbi:MAG: phosphatidate cytidylyltransferase [Bacteroidales bacterium]|nr:phosphatidate cytidylyltransferase [Bacteroidales bacterium]MBD5301915.1 phosphatidate cytidylyltransferase [Bacteroides sp.]
MDLRKVGVRALSGIVYCAVIIGCILWGYQGVTLLAFVFSILGCIEFAKINRDLDSRTFPTLILDVLGCVSLCCLYVDYIFYIWAAIMVFRFIIELYISTDNPLKGLSHSMLTQIYIGFPMAVMTWISVELSPMLLLAIFFLLWINDTGAFLVGSLIGKHKLFERISPKKTWEGFFGGFIFCLIASALFYLYCNNFFETDKIGANMCTWLILGALVSIFGTWGDLIESMIKRSANVKDSGNLIPGHGGILDRIDSLLLVLPVFGIFLALLNA